MKWVLPYFTKQGGGVFKLLRTNSHHWAVPGGSGRFKPKTIKSKEEKKGWKKHREVTQPKSKRWLFRKKEVYAIRFWGAFPKSIEIDKMYVKYIFSNTFFKILKQWFGA